MLRNTLEKVFWALAIATFPLFVVVLVWISITTGNYIRVLDYRYDPVSETVTMSRNVLVKEDVVVKSYISVTGSDGETCFDRDERVYSPFDDEGTPKTTDVFHVPERLKKCLDSAPYELVGRFHTSLLGLLNLKPTWYFEPPRG